MNCAIPLGPKSYACNACVNGVCFIGVILQVQCISKCYCHIASVYKSIYQVAGYCALCRVQLNQSHAITTPRRLTALIKTFDCSIIIKIYYIITKLRGSILASYITW